MCTLLLAAVVGGQSRDFDRYEALLVLLPIRLWLWAIRRPIDSPTHCLDPYRNAWIRLIINWLWGKSSSKTTLYHAGINNWNDETILLTQTIEDRCQDCESREKNREHIGHNKTSKRAGGGLWSTTSWTKNMRKMVTTRSHAKKLSRMEDWNQQWVSKCMTHLLKTDQKRKREGI